MTLISSRTTGCPVCGASACGCTSPDYRPREHVIEMEDLAMVDEKPKKLEHYEVAHDNGTVATYKMNEEDAKRVGAKKRSQPGSARAEGATEPVTPAAKARNAPNNKAQ